MSFESLGCHKSSVIGNTGLAVAFCLEACLDRFDFSLHDRLLIDLTQTHHNQFEQANLCTTVISFEPQRTILEGDNDQPQHDDGKDENGPDSYGTGLS